MAIEFKEGFKKNSSIGVFDSGFGGLDILREIVKKLPRYDYIYLGDSARAPYGTRSQELVYKFTEQAVDFLLFYYNKKGKFYGRNQNFS